MTAADRHSVSIPMSRRQFLGGVFCTLCGMAVTSNWPSPGRADSRSETPARFYTKLSDRIVQCELCFRRCLLEDKDIGYCEIRVNRGGNLFTMGYGNPGALNIDPIEKKPFYHVLPGTNSFSIACVGCNIDCKFCQNWQIAQAKPGDLRTREMAPGDIVSEAEKNKCRTIAYTYSEPTVWAEYVMDCADESNKKSIYSLVVSNGTWSSQALDELLTKIKAIKIDFKSIEPAYYRDICNGELQPVLDTILRIKKSGVWLELVNLVIPTLNDSDTHFIKMARWIKSHIGTDVPLHFTRFHPMYRLTHLPPTPLPVFDKAYDIARSEGLKYVYVGNVPKHKAQHTQCPKCSKQVIIRDGFSIKEFHIVNGKCSSCQCQIPGIWK